MQTIEGKAFEVMETLAAERERFDVVVIDPPAFIKKKKDIPFHIAHNYKQWISDQGYTFWAKDKEDAELNRKPALQIK